VLSATSDYVLDYAVPESADRIAQQDKFHRKWIESLMKGLPMALGERELADGRPVVCGLPPVYPDTAETHGFAPPRTM
jgi:hypothetical protein